MLCPIDFKPCCDDLCYGGGCIRSEGEDMIEVCDGCHQPIVDGYCDCEPEFDEDYNDDDYL